MTPEQVHAIAMDIQNKRRHEHNKKLHPKIAALSETREYLRKDYIHYSNLMFHSKLSNVSFSGENNKFKLEDISYRLQDVISEIILLSRSGSGLKIENI